ncbi:EndoU domain-containing protein [Kiloniella antarctica]|uniref:EndoU domain-containing protein n=1 Tax=Kiloniella antarctica TaxID=1550907 RepID=A0ABW5BNL6_9PROT
MMRIITVQMIMLFLLLPMSVGAQSFQSFFDTQNEKINDPTPHAPIITKIGHEVLRLCGDWESAVSQVEFLKMLSGKHGDELLNLLQIRMNNDGLSLNVMRGILYKDNGERLKIDFTKIWFDANGFRHIFCGEPKANKVAGLHYRGRYLQMQEEGWGGIDLSCHRMQISQPVYTIGIFYQRPNKSKRRSCVKGYSHSLDAEELFLLRLQLPIYWRLKP